jgi:hypothetical protein
VVPVVIRWLHVACDHCKQGCPRQSRRGASKAWAYSDKPGRCRITCKLKPLYSVLRLQPLALSSQRLGGAYFA